MILGLAADQQVQRQSGGDHGQQRCDPVNQQDRHMIRLADAQQESPDVAFPNPSGACRIHRDHARERAFSPLGGHYPGLMLPPKGT